MSAQQPRSVLLGLLGRGIGGSQSPTLHEREAAEHHRQLVYRLVDFGGLNLGAEDLSYVLASAEMLGYDGFNVTHPFKTAIVPLLHELSPEASALGAVNTVVLRDGRRTGHNTDWYGFAESMRRGLPDAELENVAQIGAGGAGAATAYAMLTLGTQRLLVSDIDHTRAEALADKLGRLFPDRAIFAEANVCTALLGCNGLVQATPLGMSGHPGIPIPPQLLRKDMWVADVVYTPAETALLAQARARGCRTINGYGMLVFQAAKAFQIFTGIAPDADRMLRSFMTSQST